MREVVFARTSRDRLVARSLVAFLCQGTPGPFLTMYGSSETHNWAQKVAALIGLGKRAYRQVPCKPDYTMDIDALREAIERVRVPPCNRNGCSSCCALPAYIDRGATQDRAAGYLPFCVLGTVGTVNTGAYDDLNALADLCEEQDLWLHVDGAFGAIAQLVPRYSIKWLDRQRQCFVGFPLKRTSQFFPGVYYWPLRLWSQHFETISKGAICIGASTYRGTVHKHLLVIPLN